MNQVLSKLWYQQDGAIVSVELILLVTVLVIGIVVGVKSIRDAVVTELADVAQAIANFSQSYFYSGVSGHGAASSSSEFVDRADSCDRKNLDNPQQSKGVNVNEQIVTPLNPGAEGANSP